MASRRTPASVSNHHVAPPFPQGARRCSASAPLGVGSRRAAAIPGGECAHPQFVHGRGHGTRLWTVRSCFSVAVGSATIRILRVTPFPLSWPVCDVRFGSRFFLCGHRFDRCLYPGLVVVVVNGSYFRYEAKAATPHLRMRPARWKARHAHASRAQYSRLSSTEQEVDLGPGTTNPGPAHDGC